MKNKKIFFKLHFYDGIKILSERPMKSYLPSFSGRLTWWPEQHLGREVEQPIKSGV